MNKKNIKIVIGNFIVAAILYLISILILDDISFLFAGIATILVGIALFILIYEVSNRPKREKMNTKKEGK